MVETRQSFPCLFVDFVVEEEEEEEEEEEKKKRKRGEKERYVVEVEER